MEAMRESWTDRRLDDFAAHTDHRFDGVDRRFDEVDRRFDEVDRRFDEVDRRFDAVERRMEDGFARVDADIRELRTEMAAFNRAFLQLGGGMIVTFAVGFAGLILVQL
jgi:hypothetical protein